MDKQSDSRPLDQCRLEGLLLEAPHLAKEVVALENLVVGEGAQAIALQGLLGAATLFSVFA